MSADLAIGMSPQLSQNPSATSVFSARQHNGLEVHRTGEAFRSVNRFVSAGNLQETRLPAAGQAHKPCPGRGRYARAGDGEPVLLAAWLAGAVQTSTYRLPPCFAHARSIELTSSLTADSRGPTFMAKRRSKSNSSPNTAKPLPKSREALALLLQSTQDILAFLSPSVQAQETRLQRLRKTLKSPPRTSQGLRKLLEEAGYLKEVTKANRNRFAQGGPPLDTLKPYLASADLAGIIKDHQSASKQMRELTPRHESPPLPEAWKPCVAALGALVDADRAFIGLVSELQHRVIAALDEIQEKRADRADKTSDSREGGRVRLPKNPDVLRLAKLINDGLEHERSQSDIALQFTDGDKKRAQNLLRQLRRYSHLLCERKE